MPRDMAGLEMREPAHACMPACWSGPQNAHHAAALLLVACPNSPPLRPTSAHAHTTGCGAPCAHVLWGAHPTPPHPTPPHPTAASSIEQRICCLLVSAIAQQTAFTRSPLHARARTCVGSIVVLASLFDSTKARLRSKESWPRMEAYRKLLRRGSAWASAWASRLRGGRRRWGDRNAGWGWGVGARGLGCCIVLLPLPLTHCIRAGWDVARLLDTQYGLY